MSTSAAQSRPADDEAKYAPSLLVTEIEYDADTEENDGLEQIRRQPSLPWPSHVTNQPTRRRISAIQGVDPVMVYVAPRNATTGSRQYDEARGDCHAAIEFLRPPPPSPEYAPQDPLASSLRSPRQDIYRTSLLPMEALASQRPLSLFPSPIPREPEVRTAVPPFPYPIPRESNVINADPPFPNLAGQPGPTAILRHATVRPQAALRPLGASRPPATLTPTTTTQGPAEAPSTTAETPMVLPTRYQTVTRAHVQVCIRLRGQRKRVVLSRDPREPSQPKTPAHRQAFSEAYIDDQAHTQAEGVEVHAQVLLPHEARSVARQQARREARRDASPSPARGREPRPGTDHHFRRLLRRYSSRAALLTPSSRPLNSIPPHARPPRPQPQLQVHWEGCPPLSPWDPD
jgi:hypothetical protein